MDKITWEYWGMMIACAIFGIINCAWLIRLASKYKIIKRHVTKRIDVVITGRVKLHRSYTYSFLGLNEYEGVAFYDWWIRVQIEHEIGETVSLLINENNVEEFWFEEAIDYYRKDAIVLGVGMIMIFLCFILIVGSL